MPTNLGNVPVPQNMMLPLLYFTAEMVFSSFQTSNVTMVIVAKHLTFVFNQIIEHVSKRLLFLSAFANCDVAFCFVIGAWLFPLSVAFQQTLLQDSIHYRF
ncbi:hypothetical protein GOODEAATRI_003502 [Goodea atripinnis]|uniref:Uncharacterized protein n=1 Tax=Goodea atripinnis TaxID=208336 RepID=A0ABV0P315_9TELE